MPNLEYQDLLAMPTIENGHTSDLKLDTGTMRVWITRMRLQDGELCPIQVEKLVDGEWTDVTTPESWHKDRGSVSRMKDHIVDSGPYRGFKITTITRNHSRWST